jgi:hypothetical protein
LIGFGSAFRNCPWQTQAWLFVEKGLVDAKVSTFLKMLSNFSNLLTLDEP